jgi:uncharacterized protein (UPF0332 family)
MLREDARRKATAHLKLAEGFLGTADIEDSFSIYRLRNALSRAYYAIFHVCCAWLFAAGLEIEEVKRIADDHGRLHREVGSRTNRFFRRFLEEAYDLRRRADYEPDWVPPNLSAARDHIKRLRRQFYWMFGTARRNIASK